MAAWYQTERSSVDLRSSILRSSLEGHRLASLLNPTDGEVMMSWARLLTKAYAPTRDINYLLQAAQKYRLMWGCLHASPPSTSAAVLDSLDQSSKDSDSLSLSDSGNQPVHSLSPYLTPADAFHLSPMLIRQGSAPALPDTPNPLKTYPEWLFELAEPLDLLTAVEIYQANLDHIPMSSSASSSSPASRVHREWTVDNRELPYLSFSALPLVFRRARVTYLHLDFTLPGADDTFSSQLLEAALTNSRGHLHELSITESVRLTSVAGFTAVATHLTRIDFSGSRNILAPTLTKLIKGSGPTLKHLALREVGYVCDRVLGSISKHAHGLRHLNLDRCRKASPAGFCQLLGQLGRLRELDLSGTQLTSVAIRRAKCLSRLTQLRLNHCLLLDSAGVMGLASQISSQLNELQLSGIKASDRSFSALAKACSGLISLSLQSLPSISDGTIQKFVSRNPGLITLDLRHCPELSRRSLPVISKGCPELQSLSFDGISGTRDSTPNDKHICPIAALTWLTTLRLTHCPLVTDVSIKTTAETSPLLHTLVLDHCIQITDSSLLAIAQHCTLLKDLSLRGCKNISNSAIAAFPKRCTLERIDISGNELVCDDGLISIALTAPLFLTSIEISHCINITDRSIAALAKGCFCLQTLNVAGCRRITDQGATHLASLSALEYLNLGFCWRLTDASVCVLVRTLANLVELCLSGTSVTQAVLLAIPQTKLSKSLKSLLLSSCERVDPTGIEASLSCLNLQEIALPPRMTGASLASLTSFQRLLTHLHLSHSIIDDEMLAVAAPNLVNLRQLILRDCPSINEGLAAIATHCPLLDGLDLTNSANVSSASLTAITNHCPSLSHLLLRGCLNIDHLTVFVAIKHCRLLALVELGGLGCSHLNSSSLSTQKPSKSVPQPPTLIGELSSSSQIKISPSRPSANYAVKNSTSSPDLSAKSSVKIFSKNLTSLSVHHAALTHSAFSAIFQRSPHLTLLDLSFSFIDDRILGRIAKYCPALRIAHFVGSSLLTGAGILHLCAKLRIISEIDLSLCDGIRFDALDLLRERHPQITFVHSQKHVTQCWLK
ncbi:MAG: hypothetical protein Q8P67_17675 [archaeon]|nr:hypothetical protein [archaeon]